MEADKAKHEEMQKKARKKYMRYVRNILRSKLNGGNIITTIKLRAVSVIIYMVGIIGWTKGEIEWLDQKKRKLLTMCGVIQPKVDVDRLCLMRPEGGKGLIRVKDRVRMELKNLRKYLQKTY